MNRLGMMRSHWLLVEAGVAVLGLLTFHVSAATWVGSVGSFTNGPNWDTGVPTNGVSASVDNGGTARFDGGSVSVGAFSLGDALSMSGTLSMTAGTFANTFFFVGCSGAGSVTQTGGDILTSVVFADPAFGLAVFPGSVGAYLLSGGSLTLSGSDGNFQIGGHGPGTFTQTGGAVNTPVVEKLGGSSATFNFDGGTLRANGSGASLPSFMQGLTAANVKAGGAVIDSNGKTVTISQNLSGVSSFALLRHRWSFNGDLTDSVGGRTATAVGAVTSDGTQYTLAGNGSRGSSYIDLGPNILPGDGVTPVTIELWATQHAVQSWSRIFDCGVDQNNTMIMSWSVGGDLNNDRVKFRSSAGTPSTLLDASMAPYTLDAEWHIAMVLTPGAGAGGLTLAQWYKMDAAGNTVRSGSLSVNYSPATVSQANMWLGHSEWPDNDASASYDEVRIWNAALTEAQLQQNSLRGPDAPLTLHANGSLPTDARVTVEAGATLELGGSSQTLAELSGRGLVTNGTLVATGTTAPGGTNTIGTLTIAAATALTGTLLVDVAPDGSSDLLKVQCDLNLTGLALQIQDVSQLKANNKYLIATCTPGGLTGPFGVTNLDTGRWGVAYNKASGQVRLVTRGLLVLL